MWRDLVAMVVLAALFVAAMLSMPGDPPTERERFLRERWMTCEQNRGVDAWDNCGDLSGSWCAGACASIFHPAWVHILARRVGLRIPGRYAWRLHPEEWIVVGNERAARAAMEVGP